MCPLVFPVVGGPTGVARDHHTCNFVLKWSGTVFSAVCFGSTLSLLFPRDTGTAIERLVLPWDNRPALPFDNSPALRLKHQSLEFSQACALV